MSMIGELVAKLRRYSQQAYNNYEEDASKELKQAADTIEELSAKLAVANMERSSQYYNGGWIPVSERLPEDSGEYWITENNDGRRTRLVHFVAKYHLSFEEFLEAFEIYPVAWKPVEPPEPYKGVE